MQPKTKLQHQVVALSSKLPKISPGYIAWGNKQNFDHYAYTTKHTAVCFECGKNWKAETGTLLFKLTDVVCPHCKKKLKVKESKSWSHTDRGYFRVLTTHKGFQIMRIFWLQQYVKKGYVAKYSCMEVVQHWIAPNGKLTILARGSNGMGSWQSGRTLWVWGSGLEVRDNDNSKFYINDDEGPTYPRTNIVKTLYRNGFTGDYFKFNEMYFFHLLLNQPMFETLVKADQTDLVKHFEPKSKIYIKYWPQIKICIRNNYKVRDASMWFDHLRFLEEDKKDIFNAKYICPKDLRKVHQVYIDKRQAKRDKEELEKQLVMFEKLQKKYAEQKSKFFGLKFGDNNVKIVVLDHIKEFYLEGKAHHHCVFSSNYYDDPDKLIMSARNKDDKRLETIEINLKAMKVVQVRGTCNQDSKEHKKILSILETALPHIESVYRAKKKKKVKEVA